MNDFESAFQRGEQTKIVETEIEGIKHILVPESCKLQSMEHLLPAPKRLKSRAVFHDLASFKAYIEKFKEDDSVIYLDSDNRNFKTIFDHHGKDKPTWGEHTASLSLQLSPEWIRFKQFDGESLSPREFAEFIEDNIDYVSAQGMDAADLITLAETYRVNVRGDIEVNETLHAGMRKLHITNDSTVSGGTGERTLEVPKELDVNMRFFMHGSTYKTKVYLRYRLEHGLKFFIKVPDPEGIEENALNAYSDKVASETGLNVHKGCFT